MTDLRMMSEADLRALQDGDMSKVSEQGLSMLANGAPPPGGKPPSGPPMSPLEKIAQGLRDPIDAGAQLLRRAIPEPIARGIDAVGNAAADLGLPVARSNGVAGVDKLVRDNESAYQAKRTNAGESGIDGYRLLGNVVNPVSVAGGVGAARLLPQVASMTGRIAQGAATGAIGAGLTSPVTGEGSFWEQKAQQAGAGAIGGAIAPVVTGGIARVISPNASTNAELQLLRNEGVRPTLGQTLGGAWNRTEQKLASLPLLGDFIGAQRARAQEEFNNAAINRATAPIGTKVSGSGQSAVAEAGDAISDAYTKAQGMLGRFTIDQRGAQQLTQLRMAAGQLPPQEASSFNRILNEIQTDVAQNGSITAEGFKRIDSKLGQEAARFSGSSDAYQKQLGESLGQFRQALQDAAYRANPKAQEALKAADKAYANLVRIEGASVGAKNSGGVFTPGQLNTAVRQADRSTRDRATARGQALMQDLSGAGQSVLGNTVPNSGTPDRLFLTGAGLTGAAGYAIDPLAAAAVGTGLIGYTTPIQKLLTGAVASRPQGAKAIADSLRKGAPALLPAAGQVGAGLLSY